MSTETKFRITKKVCRCCGERKAVEEFYRNAERRDGYLDACRPCHIARVDKAARERRAASRAKWAAIAAEAAASE